MVGLGLVSHCWPIALLGCPLIYPSIQKKNKLYSYIYIYIQHPGNLWLKN